MPAGGTPFGGELRSCLGDDWVVMVNFSCPSVGILGCPCCRSIDSLLDMPLTCPGLGAPVVDSRALPLFTAVKREVGESACLSDMKAAGVFCRSTAVMLSRGLELFGSGSAVAANRAVPPESTLARELPPKMDRASATSSFSSSFGTISCNCSG